MEVTMKRTLLVALMLCLMLSFALAQEMQPGTNRVAYDTKEHGIQVPHTRTAPEFTFTKNPTAIITNYYDYMIGSYNGLPLRVIPQSADGGYFMTYHGRRQATATRRAFYTYIDAQGNIVNNNEISTQEQMLSAFIQLYYAEKDELPDEILLPFAPAEIEELNNWLGNKLQIPQRGEKSKLLAMAKSNAFHLIEERKLSHLRKSNRTIFPIQELKEKLSLPKLPRKIVCMDISTIQGTDTVSSAVFFENGKAKKKYYRHFIIRSIDTQNDFAALQETLTRLLVEIEKYPEMKPDLLVIDGGKGQLSSCYATLISSGVDISIISLAKRAEEVYLPKQVESIILSRSSSALRLLTNIRDEAHRFAINFHRSRRSKRTLISELEDVPGIGEKTKFMLLKELGSVSEIRNCTEEQLGSLPGIGPKTAKMLFNHFHHNS